METKQAENRETKEFVISTTFGVTEDPAKLLKNEDGSPMLDEKGNQKLRTCLGFAEPGPLTPAIDPNYVFPKEELSIILMSMFDKDRLLMVGPSGVGKSTIIEQVAARLNYNIVKLAFDGNLERKDLVGQWVIKGKSKDEDIMQFIEGTLVYGMRLPGTIILLDEWDTISPECAFVLQRVLDKNDGRLLLLEKNNELIGLHPQNCIVATANTNGQGDDTGNYTAGTKIQNFSQLNRFNTTILMDYLPKEQEVKIIQTAFNMSDARANSLVTAMNSLREANNKGEISVPVTTRDLKNWARKIQLMKNPFLSAKYTFSNRMSREDRVATEGILQHHFGNGEDF